MLQTARHAHSTPATTSAAPPVAPLVASVPDLSTLLECVVRHWLAATVVGVLFAAAGAAVVQFGMTCRFKATAMVRLAGPDGLVEKPNESSNAQREFRSTQQELIRMPHVLRRALERPEVAALGEFDTDADSIEELSDLLTLELPRSSEILRISIQHPQAKSAHVLANAVTEAYLTEVHREHDEDLVKRLNVLDKLHDGIDGRLSQAWGELQELARKLGAGDPAALSLQAQAEIENYRAYARRMRELRAERRDAERTVKAIEESPELLNKEAPEEASMHSVKFAMFQAKLKKEQALGKWGPNHPEVQAALQEENLLKEYYQKAIADEAADKPKDRKAELLAEPLATIARLKVEEASLQELIREIEARIETLGGDSAAKLEVLRNDINRMEKLSDRLWQTRETLQVEQHADKRVQLVALSNQPTQRDTSKRDKLTVVLAGGGFGFAFFLTAVGEFLTGRVHSRRDAARRTGIDLIAELPALPESLSDRETACDSRSQARLRTRLDMFVAQLIHHPSATGARVLLVSSARAARERAGVALHLAGALARSGKSTLLLPLDVRDQPPALDPSADATTAGLAGLVRRATREFDLRAWHELFEQTSWESPIDGLSVLPAGELPNGPLPLVMDHRFPACMKALSERFDYVVVDVAAVLDFPDAAHVGRTADLAVLSLLRNVSSAGRVAEAQGRLAGLGLPAVGALLA